MSGSKIKNAATAGDRRTGAHRASLQGVFCLLSSVLCLLVGTGCAKRDSGWSPGSTLRIAQRNEPATLDPQLATLPDEFFIIRALSEGLATPSPTGGTPLPAVACRWENSPDGLTWTFYLDRASVWSTGEPVTAQDFVYLIQRAQAPATAAPKAALFQLVLAATAPDPQTLVIKLRHASPDFLALIASGPWIPVHRATVEKFGRNWTRPEHYVGNGRFLLADWMPGQRIGVRKNAQHRDAAATLLTGIEFLAFDNGDTEERAFRSGQIDVTMAVPITKLDTYHSTEPSLLRTVPLYETRYLAVNTLRPPLNDVRVRHALSLALDRGALVTKVLKAGQRPALTFVPRGLGDHQPLTMLTEDAAEARRLLAEAGFPGGRGFPKLELSTWPVSTSQLEAIQAMWREQLGIEVAIVQREARTHLAALAGGAYDLGFATAIPEYDSAADLLTRLTTDDPSNYPHWSDAEYDRLVAGGGSDLTRAESRLLTSLPVIPLYFNTKNFLLRPTVRGWKEDALWTRYYDHLSLAKD